MNTHHHRSLGRRVAVLFLLGLLACSNPGAKANPGQSPGQRTPAEPSGSPLAPIKAPAQLVTSLNLFSVKLYRPVAESMPGNLAVSPLGSYILLGLLHEGAVGPARQEIEAVTGLKAAADLEALTELVKGLDARQSLALAQKIYISDTITLVPAFLEAVAPLLAEPVQTLAFQADPMAATKIINDWVEEHTAGLIKNFLPDLPPDTNSVLVSVLHFKGAWKTKFDKQQTTPLPFHPTPEESINVNVMSMHDVPTVEVAGARGVILPYTEDFDMVFLLPGEKQSLQALAAALDPAKLPRVAEGPKGILQLPRFEFTVPTFQLTGAWQSIGLKQAVSNPDLSGMIVKAASNLELKVFHQTYIRVDEEGTEAAAATAVAIVPTSAGPPPNVLNFNRPFMFVLRHSGTGAILMLGKVERPQEATN